VFRVFSEFQQLANRKQEIESMRNIDKETQLRMLKSLRTSYNSTVEEHNFTFTLPSYEDIELKAGGMATPVTLGNLQEYIDLSLHYMMHETIKVQVSAFRKGFNSIFPVDNLACFTAQELEDMVCGTLNDDEWTNEAKLQEFIIPKNGYHSKSPQYLHFIKLLASFNKD